VQQNAWKKRVFRRAMAAIGAIAVALVALLVWSWYQRTTESVHLAVLPFRTTSGDPGLAMAVTDSLAGHLARIRGFTILPIRKTAPFADSRDSANAIAKALGVRYIVMGSVNRSPTAAAPDRITITARLIDTQDSPPAVGDIVNTLSTNLCPGTAIIAVDFAGHFARAPRGALWGAGGTTGCAAPLLLERRDDPNA
jgi:TolB-like protein